MNNQFLLNFLHLLLNALQLLLLARVLLSWIPTLGQGSAWRRWLEEVTDPIILPFQKILPPTAGLDFSPLLALITLQVINRLIGF